MPKLSGIWWEPGNFQPERPRRVRAPHRPPAFHLFALEPQPPAPAAARHIAALFGPSLLRHGQDDAAFRDISGTRRQRRQGCPGQRIWSGQPFCRALYQPTLPQMWYKPCPTCFPCRPAPFKQKGKDAEHQAILPNGKIGGKSYGICTHICISATCSTNFSHFRMYPPFHPSSQRIFRPRSFTFAYKLDLLIPSISCALFFPVILPCVFLTT